MVIHVIVNHSYETFAVGKPYAYDALGQLIRVNDPHENATWIYNYDRGGNILSKAKYAYTTGSVGTALETIPYAYSDSNWKDKLTAYNGTAITYDAIGNPLNDGTWSYEWAAGRQLKKMTREGQSLTFKYDHNGMRIQKVLEHSWYPETTNYTYHGKLLTHMTVDYYDWDEVAQQDKLHFFYDAQSRPAKVSYNGNIYTYLHNLQGDIVGLLDNSGALVVEYKYDAWGKPLSMTGSLADTLGIRNPFRYRGYVYDEENELYYLCSRFYTSQRMRFLNADSRATGASIFGSCSLFSYCGNGPVCNADPSGHTSVPVKAPQTGDVYLDEILLLATLLVGAIFPLAQKKARSRTARPSDYWTVSSITSALVKSATVNAQKVAEELFNYQYYFAFTSKTSSGYGYLTVVDYPLSLQQAVAILDAESAINSLRETFKFGEGKYGIYTPTLMAALNLANVAFSGAAPEKHFPKKATTSGEYYYHFHDALHSYHIWFGLPTIFPEEE